MDGIIWKESVAPPSPPSVRAKPDPGPTSILFEQPAPQGTTPIQPTILFFARVIPSCVQGHDEKHLQYYNDFFCSFPRSSKKNGCTNRQVRASLLRTPLLLRQASAKASGSQYRGGGGRRIP